MADGFGRGANIDEQGCAIRDDFGCRLANRFFFIGGDPAARLIFHILNAGWIKRPAMNAAEQARAAQIVEILAHGLRRDIKSRSQIVHQDLPLTAGKVQNCIVTRGKLHFLPALSLLELRACNVSVFGEKATAYACLHRFQSLFCFHALSNAKPLNRRPKCCCTYCAACRPLRSGWLRRSCA